MNLFVAFAGSLALGTLLHPAQAQTTPPATTKSPSPGQAKTIRTQTANQRAATYKGPHVVKDSKALGRKFLRESEPVPSKVTPPPVAPVKQ